MSASGLDPRLTFETFISGPANRLASAAAVRVAEAPASTYNPLLLYGASGLGKTHLLMAIGNRAVQLRPRIEVHYSATESLFGQPVESGKVSPLRERLANIDLLLLDDAHFLGGRADAQAQLLLAWDAIVATGGQIVLASDRPPNEIEGLDVPLASRCAGGLIADLAPPEHETRLRIVQRRLVERDQVLGDGVADVLARLAFGSVRELYGALNRICAAQDLEGRLLRASEVPKLLGLVPESAGAGEFGSFLREMSGAVGEALERLSPEQLLAEAIMRWEAEGFRTMRLEAALTSGLTVDQAKDVIATFDADAARLRELIEAARALDAAAPELARVDVLRDPDRVDAAAALLARVTERLGENQRADASRDDELDDTGAPQVPAFNADATAQWNDAPQELGTEAEAASPSGAPRGDAVAVATEDGVMDRWFLSREKVLWEWPYIEDAIVAEDD